MNAMLRGALAGLLLALIEIAVVVARDRTLFLSSRELGRYALVALLCLPALGGVLAFCASRVARALERGNPKRTRPLQLVVGALSAPLVSTLLWTLSEGRRVRDLPGRGVGVVVSGLVAGVFLAWLATWLTREARARRVLEPAQPPSARRRGSLVMLALLALAAISLCVDALVLRRLYPAFHLGLTALAWLAALAAVALVPLPLALARASASRKLALLSALVLAGLCGVGLIHWNASARNPGLRFSIEQAAPHTGKLLALHALERAPVVQAPRGGPSKDHGAKLPSAAEPALAARAGIDLRDRDVLLVTIDALRADRLAAYGGQGGLTPAIDALAAGGRVFLRGYTPTPHTSYAVMSMLSGKPLALLYALGGVRQAPVTLPELLRRNGYRTAAFYPPAIFYVDEDRFAALADEHMGFEYVKAQYATGPERVEELRAYLAEADRDHPLFVWIHLFEPHEPYEPPARFARGDSAEARYDGEVAAADAATGELVALFRSSRPDATVIISADHGEEHGDHGGYHHGTTLFDEQARVPIVWSSPGVVAPGSTLAPLELLDLPTTLLAALGIPKDARMQGDDLGAVLADRNARGPAFAFASLPDLSMTTDGVLKLICATRSGGCQLFDLEADPRERADLSAQRPLEVARLRAGWDAFVSQVPTVEALDLSGQAWPAALARARLGDASVASELVALLGAPRAEVRAEAAAALGELHALQAVPVLARMLTSEPDPNAAAQVAIAALRLGHEEAREPVARLLEPDASRSSHAQHAALALAHAGDARGERVLLASASSAALPEPERIAALRALAVLGASKLLSRRALPTIAKLLSEVRLREEISAALSKLGDKRAIPALRRALREETHPGARAAEALALESLGDGATAKRLLRAHARD